MPILGGENLSVTVHSALDVHRPPRSQGRSRRASPYGRKPHGKLPPLPVVPSLPTPGLSNAIDGLAIAGTPDAPISTRTRRAKASWAQPAPAAAPARAPLVSFSAATAVLPATNGELRYHERETGIEFDEYLKLHGWSDELENRSRAAPKRPARLPPPVLVPHPPMASPRIRGDGAARPIHDLQKFGKMAVG